MTPASFKPFEEIFAGDTFLPQNPTLANYVSLFEQSDALRKIWNSFYISASATILSVFLCALGGYTFAKFRFPGRGFLFTFMLASMAIPFAVVMVPLFVICYGRLACPRPVCKSLSTCSSLLIVYQCSVSQ